MFLPSDSVSEAIAHFIGCFDIRVDEMRMRQSYEEFYHEQHLAAAAPIQHVSPGFFQRLELEVYIPGVSYRQPYSDAHIDFGVPPQRIDIVEGFVPGLQWHPTNHLLWPVLAGGVEFTAEPGPSFGPVPASVMLSANQVMLLDDNDFIVLGSADVGAMRYLPDAGPVQQMLALGLAVSEPFASLEAPSEVEKIPAYFASAEAAIAAIAGEQNSDGQIATSSSHQSSAGFTQDMTTVTGSAIGGLYVNGTPAETLPSLNDALPAQLQELVAEPDPEDVSTASLTIDPSGVSVTLESGANMMVNEAFIANAGLTSTFLAVAGDYHSINAIIQTNVHSDLDTLDSRLTSNGAETAAYNVASFVAELRDNAADVAAGNPGVFPTNWQITVVQGDMVFLDWISQFSFTTDTDTHVLTAVGTTTTITSGENLGLNGVSMLDLGRYYDLVIVGGSLYDGNFVIQTNVLYDNDTVAMLSGALGNGEVSSSGNLLWNSASILNVGSGNIVSGLPDYYGDAIASLGAADYSMPGSFSSDGAFEGFGNLRVLFIAGDLYDLHAVQQVNVMGDADLVALYEDNVTAGASADEWSISTGSNALINVASIVDYDSVGSDVHVGGQIYSDAILIQADLVADSNTAPVTNDALVSEVIAFLDIDMETGIPGEIDNVMVPMGDGGSVDAMQSVLA